MKPLSPELAQKALEEVNEKPEQRERDIQALRMLVIEEKNLKLRTDDAYLVRFLRSCKYDVPLAFQTIQKFCKMKANDTELYRKFRPSCLLKLLNQHPGIVLPQRDNYGRRIVYLRFGEWNPAVSPFEDLFICLQIGLESVIDEDETQICGIVMIWNLDGFGLTHIMNMSLRTIKKCMSLLQDSFPARIRGVHFLNAPSVFENLYNVCKVFLKKELTPLMHFHGQDLKSLHEYIPPEFLPQDLGGLKPVIDYDSFIKSLQERDDELANEIAKYGYV